MSIFVKIPQLIDLALGTPEVGAVNFNILHAVLHVMAQYLRIDETRVEFRGSQQSIIKGLMSFGDEHSTVTEYDVKENDRPPYKSRKKISERKSNVNKIMVVNKLVDGDSDDDQWKKKEKSRSKQEKSSPDRKRRSTSPKQDNKKSEKVKSRSEKKMLDESKGKMDSSDDEKKSPRKTKSRKDESPTGDKKGSKKSKGKYDESAEEPKRAKAKRDDDSPDGKKGKQTGYEEETGGGKSRYRKSDESSENNEDEKPKSKRDKGKKDTVIKYEDDKKAKSKKKRDDSPEFKDKTIRDGPDNKTISDSRKRSRSPEFADAKEEKRKGDYVEQLKSVRSNSPNGRDLNSEETSKSAPKSEKTKKKYEESAEEDQSNRPKKRRGDNIEMDDSKSSKYSRDPSSDKNKSKSMPGKDQSSWTDSNKVQKRDTESAMSTSITSSKLFLGPDEIKCSLCGHMLQLQDDFDNLKTDLLRVALHLNMSELIEKLGKNMEEMPCLATETQPLGFSEEEKQLLEVLHIKMEKFERTQPVLEKRTIQLEKDISDMHNIIEDIIEKEEGSNTDQHGVVQLYQEFHSMKGDVDQIVHRCDFLNRQTTKGFSMIEEIIQMINPLKLMKANKSEIAEQLSLKADVSSLEKMVKLEQFQETTEYTTKGIMDASSRITAVESFWSKIFDEIKKHLEQKVDQPLFHQFQEFMDDKLVAMQARIEVLAAIKREAEAAGTTTKILRNVNCISCQQNAIMNTEEPSLVPAFDVMVASKSMKPILTYELDQIRNHQRDLPNVRNMNHFQMLSKDKRNIAELSKNDMYCTRYCGGSHTANTASEKFAKRNLPRSAFKFAQYRDQFIKGTDGCLYKGTATGPCDCEDQKKSLANQSPETKPGMADSVATQYEPPPQTDVKNSVSANELVNTIDAGQSEHTNLSVADTDDTATRIFTPDASQNATESDLGSKSDGQCSKAVGSRVRIVVEPTEIEIEQQSNQTEDTPEQVQSAVPQENKEGEEPAN